MRNFKQDILIATQNEVILSVVFLNNTRGYHDEHKVIADDELNTTISWERAAPVLDYAFEAGYGSRDCHSVLIYTASNVYYVQEYDGSTWLESIPRNPPAYR